MEVRPGYKQTEVGLIPQDWEVKPLHSITSNIMVGIASAATHAYRENGVVMFRNQNIRPGNLDDSDVLHIAPEYERKYRNKRLKPWDLLIARTGYPGTTSIVPPEYDGAQSFTTLIVRPDRQEVDPRYLCFVMNSSVGQAYFGQNQIGGAQKNVNAGSMKRFPVPLPPTVTEQEAVAGALSDADALIESLEQLIAKKRLVKQGAMQELLTAKRRLPGFRPRVQAYKQTELGIIPQDWVVTPLGKVVDRFVNGGTPSTRNESFWKGDIPWITGADIVNQTVGDIRRYITKEAVRNSSTNIVTKGALLLVSRTGVGKLAVAPFDIAISQDFTGVYTAVDQLSTVYLHRFLDLNRAILTDQKQGTSIRGITRKTLAALTIFYPPTVLEQTAIAAILTDMDAEIAALEAKLAKARQVKQGMMQELLTGRIRLV